MYPYYVRIQKEFPKIDLTSPEGLEFIRLGGEWVYGTLTLTIFLAKRKEMAIIFFIYNDNIISNNIS